MEYKILLLKNRYTKKVDFKKNTVWFKNNVGIDIVMEEISTDFELKTQNVSNNTFKGVVAGNLIPLFKTIVPENKYNAIVIIYGNDLNGIRVSACNITGNLYDNTEIVQLAKNDWKTLNHELFHAFFYKANRLKASIVDNMDSYYRDNILDTDNGDTNRMIALRILQPHFKNICSLNSLINNKPMIDLSKFKLVPEVENKAQQLLLKCAEKGYKLRITQGYRSNAEQAVLYAKGRTTPGPVVTNAKPGESKHTLGRAFDICFIGSVPYPNDDKKWKAIADIAVSLGLTAGYYFRSFKDMPHFEL